MNDTITLIIGALSTTGIGGLFGWLFSRRQYNANVKSTEVQNFDSAIDAYKKMYEAMIGDLTNQRDELQQEVASLKEELAETRKQVITLTNFVLASTIEKAGGQVRVPDLDGLRSIINQ